MDETSSVRVIRNSLLFLCFIVGLATLYLARDFMAPFALAVFIWLIIDAFARWIDRILPMLPYSVALALAILLVFAALVGISLIVVDTATDISHEAPQYMERLGLFSDWLARVTGQESLSWTQISKTLQLDRHLQNAIVGFAASLRSVFSNLAIIAIYVVFLFVAQGTFAKKMTELFPNKGQRDRAAYVAGRIRHSVEKYIGVQTVVSLIQTVLSYGVMVAFGLDNALFWAFVIFILNYIPIVGGTLAVIMPVLFAMIQFDSFSQIGGMTGGLLLVQLVLNNTLQPKMMGDSMNMSPLVVVLSLTLWGGLWGGVGAFLSAPLTVIIMLVLAQFKETKWIAILLSSDGKPDMDEIEDSTRLDENLDNKNMGGNS